MTAPAVAWYGIGSNVGKVILGDADSGWSGSLSVDTVNFVEGTASLGEKVSNATVQVQTVDTTDVIGEPFDFSASGGNDGDHLFAWLSIFAAFDTLANGGLGIVVVDDLATDSDGTWFVGPQAGYLGGWASYVINPSADFDAVTAGSATWTLSGNPAQLSGVDGFGARWKTTVTITGNTDNAFLDAFAVGLGYRLTLGDAGSSEGAFSDFVTFEDNVSSGRFGGLREISGILLAKSKLIIGDAAGGGANTEFIDSGFTVVWEQQTLSDGVTAAVAAGFYEFSVSEGTGTTDVDISSGSLAAVAPHTVVIDWSGINSFLADSVNIDRAETITLDSACTVTDCKITNSGLITHGGATMNGTSVLLSTVAADEGAVLYDETVDPDGEMDDMTFSKGTNAHHAIRFGTSVPTPMTLRGCDFSGFSSSQDNDGSVFRFDDTTGNITLNLVGCSHDGSGFTVDDAAGVVVTIVIDPVNFLVNVKDNAGVNLQNARVYAKASTGAGDYPFEDSVTIADPGR